MNINNKTIEELIVTVNETKEKVDKIESALLGDEYEQRLGLLRQVANHEDHLHQHDELLEVVNKKIEEDTGFGRLGAAAGVGGATAFGINSWSDVFSWFKNFFV